MPDLNIENQPSSVGAPIPGGDATTPQTNVTGVSDDIDKIFGASANAGTGSGDNPFGGNPSSGAGEQQVDYTGMTHEQLARMFQSKYDKAQADLQKVQPKVQKADSLEQFYNELYENQDVRRAFIAELEPDLVQPKDPYLALQGQLKKEFGEDYVPDDEEARRPFTPSWKYYRRLSELENKVKDVSNTVPKTLKELRAEREQTLREQATKDIEMKNDVLRTMRWSDTDYQSFAGWVSKLSAIDLAKIYNYAQSKRANIQGAPTLAALSGGTPQTPNEIEAELKKFFG
jgi:hypothetical protein